MEVVGNSKPAYEIQTGLGSLRVSFWGSHIPAFSHLLRQAMAEGLGGSSRAVLTVGVYNLSPFPLHPGLLPTQHPKEHGVYVSPGQELHHQQGDPEPLPVLPAAEML